MAKLMIDISQDYRDDPEVSHSQADDLMVEALRSLGYDDAMDVYDKMRKWYN